jgi:hypothetical protein
MGAGRASPDLIRGLGAAESGAMGAMFIDTLVGAALYDMGAGCAAG